MIKPKEHFVSSNGGMSHEIIYHEKCTESFASDDKSEFEEMVMLRIHK